MRKRSLLIAGLALLLTGSSIVSHATPESVFTLSGKILVATPMPPFTLKLYPPLKSGKRVLLTTSTRAGDFKFSAPPSSYLLEVYAGKQLVYQQVIQLTANQNITIDLRKSAK